MIAMTMIASTMPTMMFSTMLPPLRVGHPRMAACGWLPPPRFRPAMAVRSFAARNHRALPLPDRPRDLPSVSRRSWVAFLSTVQAARLPATTTP